MILKDKNGKTFDGKISQTENGVFFSRVGGTGANSRAELNDYINSENPGSKLSDCELIEATEEEKNLLRIGGFSPKGLD